MITFFKRTVYLGYYLKQMDWNLLRKFLDYSSDKTNRFRWRILLDSLLAVYKHNISILEYFQFRFFEIEKPKKDLWAGTGFMYESMLVLNPRETRYLLEDKTVFLKHYSQFVKHKHFKISEFTEKTREIEHFLNENSKIVLKNSFGQCGRGIEIIESKGLSPSDIKVRMQEGGNDILEEFVCQHDSLNLLSSSGLNTLRVITTLNKENQVDILGVRLRITINSSVDNLAAGNIAAPVDIKTGIVIGPGVYSDITKPVESVHPISKVNIIGFQVPLYHEAIELVRNAALFDTNNRSIGWDVAITNKGPELIEGNHDWCKLLWQLPAQNGLKQDLTKYLN